MSVQKQSFIVRIDSGRLVTIRRCSEIADARRRDTMAVNDKSLFMPANNGDLLLFL